MTPRKVDDVPEAPVPEAPARNGIFHDECEGRRAFDEKNHGKEFPGIAFPSNSQDGLQDGHNGSEDGKDVDLQNSEDLRLQSSALSAKLEDPHVRSPTPTAPTPSEAPGASPNMVPTPKIASGGPPKRRREDEDYVTMSLPPPPLTDQAVYGRMYRIFQRKQNGSKKLDDSWCDAWNDLRGGGRESLKAMFEKVGYDPERFVKKCVQLVFLSDLK